MGKLKIVTDSASSLSREEARRLDVTVIPLTINLGEESFREGVDIGAEDFLERLAHTHVLPFAVPPSLKDFQRVYDDLCEVTDQILAIHLSGRLSETFDLAQRAAEPFAGRAKIRVVDSLTISAGLRFLVTAAAEAAAQGASMAEVVRLIRGMIPRIYSIFIVENLDYLHKEGRIGKAQAVLGTMLEVKPVLVIEDGEIIPLEKVLDWEKALDKLFEFIVEFSRIEKMVILQHNRMEAVSALKERIEAAFPKYEVPVETYCSTLATYIGPGALGLIIYEGMG